MHSRLAVALVRYRLPLFLASLLLMVAAGFGFSQLTFSSDYRVFFKKDNPQLVAHEYIQNTFSRSDNILLVLHPRDGELFTPERLAAVEWLTEQAWQLPHSQRIDSLTNFQHTFVDGDDLLVEDLFSDVESMGAEDIAERKDIALKEPMLVHRLISPQGHVTAVNIELNLPGDQTAGTHAAMAESRKLRDEFRNRYPDFDIYLTGITPLNHAFEEVSQKDGETLMSLMFVIILVLVGIMLRSVSGTVVTLGIILFGVAITMGVVGHIGFQLNTVNSVAPIIILTLAVADCVHLLTHYLTARRKGLDKETAMTEALDVNMMPVFLTSLTTFIGFLSMNSSDSPPFQEFGTISAIGVAFTWLFSLTMLPFMILLLNRKVPKRDAERTELYHRIGAFTIRTP